MPHLTDTIAALATPVGTSGIAVVRVSGPDTAALAGAIFGQTPPARTMSHRDYRDRHGTLIDDVLFVAFRGPESYTGEDGFEVSCHGNPFIAQKILEDLLNRGCRAAEPGEFTRRAFLNGRMDLSQAEAVVDLIHARSERALLAANQQLRGALGRRIAGLVDALLGILARVEAYIDFPDEDLPVEDQQVVLREVERIKLEINRLGATSHYGELLRGGIKTVILGAPNVGKSSLLNRLLGRDRALVSPEPGTTRDFIEEPIVVGPHCLRLIDTAGLNQEPAPLEKLGMDKTLERAEEADLFLVVADASAPDSTLPAQLHRILRRDKTILAVNKIDLSAGGKNVMENIACKTVYISALTGLGWEELMPAIVKLADSFQPEVGEEVIAVNARHARALASASDYLDAARNKLAGGHSPELLASDLRGALDALGEIDGKVDNERMLDQLFAGFCIGK